MNKRNSNEVFTFIYAKTESVRCPKLFAIAKHRFLHNGSSFHLLPLRSEMFTRTFLCVLLL